MIGVDFAGIRRGNEHVKADAYCAAHDTFVIENMCNLNKLIGKEVIMHTYPLNYIGFSGLPCRIIGTF